ncbi:MAG: chemotaxis protein CheD [Candidatus Competibacteraceae bacterium]|nr:chemotaxis protein CheD [Candidatus Competibacteraceae bacterium]HRY14270.1 chemotaxis protein CheD [Candidatus Competibacteraceae bacterium]
MRNHFANAPSQSSIQNLLPGELYCDRHIECLSTTLGSCVAVCLWDRRLRVGGMNHFILPSCPPNTENSFRFGDIAVPELIRRMLQLGGHVRSIQAKLFGGACVLGSGSSDYAIGQRNIEIAVTELRRYRIPIVASRVLGTDGLVIRQCTVCGDVWVRQVRSTGNRPLPSAQVHNLPWLTDDIASILAIQDKNGLPAVISTRNKFTGSSACRHCSNLPY